MMMLLQMLTYLLLVWKIISAEANDDPCLGANHRFWDDPEGLRSAGNETVPHFYACDTRIREGWYRIRSPAGTDIPTQCVPESRCNTLATIWMDGPIPTDDAIHDRQVHVGVRGDCKSLNFGIQVKNCKSQADEFRVYNLRRTGGCPIAYCFGTETVCPKGSSSDTGYGPNCLDPASRTPFKETPRVHYMVGETDKGTRELVFVCTWVAAPGSTYDIEWYKNAVRVAEAKVTTSPHVLHEQDWYVPGVQNLGHQIYCRVRAQGPKFTHPSIYQKSDPFYAGIKVLTPNMEIKEGEDQPLRLHPTVPILCRTGVACKLSLDLYTISETDIRDRGCNQGNDPLAFSQTLCGADIKGITRDQDWRQRVVNDPVMVKGTLDGTFRSTRTMLIKMKSNIFLEHPVWSNYNLDPVKVNIIDKDQPLQTSTHLCYAHNDPHMMSFDKCRYEMQWEGEFVLYRHKTRPLAVHIFTKQCYVPRNPTVPYRGPYCSCAVAVRSGRDVFIVSRCDGTFQKHMFSCEDNAMTVHEEGRGQYRIVLPTGTTVKINGRTLYNIDVIPSPLDEKNVEGLCGNFDKNPHNDLIQRNGKVANVGCKMNDARRKDFAFSWRIAERHKESLREGYNNRDDRRIFIPYCTCKCMGDNCGTFAVPVAECSYKEQVDQCLQKAGNDLTENMCAEKKRRKRSLYTSDILGASGPDEPGFRAPPTALANFADMPEPAQWTNGWDEDKARLFCVKTVLGSSSGQQCSKLDTVDYDSNLDDCIADIKLTGGTDWAGDAIAAMEAACESEISKNTTRWVQDATTNQTIPPPEITATLCPANCSQHGLCQNGACECNVGYSAVDCSINENEPPVVLPLPSGGLCDMRKRPCESTVIQGDNFLASKTLTCKVEYWTVTAEGLQREKTLTSHLRAEYRGFEEVSCPLFRVNRPGNFALDNPDNPLALVYHVSVSNNNAQFSSPVTLMAYDGKCLECNTTSFQCTLKNDTCRIDGMCYRAGDHHSFDYPCDICDPASSVSSWTINNDACSIKGKCYPQGESNGHCLTCNIFQNRTSWTLVESWCYINGECVTEGENEAGGCRRCSPLNSTVSWTDSGLCKNKSKVTEEYKTTTVRTTVTELKQQEGHDIVLISITAAAVAVTVIVIIIAAVLIQRSRKVYKLVENNQMYDIK